jgi:hypothetical protein
MLMKLPELIKRCLLRCLGAVVWCSVFAGFVWAVGAIYYFRYVPIAIGIPLAVTYTLSVAIAFFRIPQKRMWLQKVSASIVVIYIITLTQQPSHDRSWEADNKIMPLVEILEDRVSISGFRNNVYRSSTDFDVSYSDLEFDVSQLKQVWFVVQRFTALEGLSHNFLTFSYDSGTTTRYFSVSVEIRRELGEQFDPVKGLYRQYELIYVIADEQDEIGSRTVFRPEDRVYMYPVQASPIQVQQLFRDIAERVNHLAASPEFYHSLLNNCTNNIVFHTYKLTPEPINWLDFRIVIPGYADRFAFSKQLIDTNTKSFPDLQQQCRIDEIARAAGITTDFSTDIRKITRSE